MSPGKRHASATVSVGTDAAGRHSLPQDRLAARDAGPEMRLSPRARHRSAVAVACGCGSHVSPCSWRHIALARCDRAVTDRRDAERGNHHHRGRSSEPQHEDKREGVQQRHEREAEVVEVRPGVHHPTPLQDDGARAPLFTLKELVGAFRQCGNTRAGESMKTDRRHGRLTTYRRCQCPPDAWKTQKSDGSYMDSIAEASAFPDVGPVAELSGSRARIGMRELHMSPAHRVCVTCSESGACPRGWAGARQCRAGEAIWW
jgi:hypothetical protein